MSRKMKKPPQKRGLGDGEYGSFDFVSLALHFAQDDRGMGMACS